jgi:hypothetical protein
MTNKKPAHHEKTPTGNRKAPRSDGAGGGDERAASGAQGGRPDFDSPEPPVRRGLGPDAGGQSGDTEGLSRQELSGPESVEELIEEGQAYEAEMVDAIENAPDADRGEVRTRQVREDDVPQEYLDED